jgi:NAD(P)-dependent dehydrogenase (short-subunit alcohol dehydrogenase family)
MRFQGKHVLITGAANGIGREMAIRFAAEGALVFSADIQEAANRQTAELVRAEGGKCEAITADVASADDAARAVQTASPVSILVNNAMTVDGDGPLHTVKESAWDRVLDVCLKSVYLFSREALPGMAKRRNGVIINISSVNALTGIHLAAYSAAKGGINSLTRVMADHYGAEGIRINTICPGTILTESSREYYAANSGVGDDLRALYPAGAFGEPGDIAAAALFLASDEARFINGAVIPVDGALTAVHRLPSVQSGF